MQRVALILGIALTCAFARPVNDVSATEILANVDNLYRGHTSYMQLTMKVVTRHFTRELAIEQWSKGTRHFLLRVLSPTKDKGTALLRSGNDLWSFLPKIARTIRLPSAIIVCDAWLGSHFTSDDFVKYTRLSDDFSVDTIEVREREGERLIELTLKPKAESAVFWGKLVVVVREKDRLPMRMTFYDEEMKPSRIMTFSDVRTLGGRTLPTKIRVVPRNKPGEFSEIRYKKIVFDQNIDDSFFTLGTMENRP